MIRFFSVVFACLVFVSGVHAQTREQKVLADRKKFEAEGYWIYNDLAKAKAEAAESGKPMIVSLRCIPCEECVKLDDELIHQDKALRKLLDAFVRVRIVATNGLDLSLFQYDYDQSFAVFFLNADGTIYGRYGTRSHRTDWAGDVSIVGLTRAMEGALELHRGYPGNRAMLAGRRGPAPEFRSPELFPNLKAKYGPKLKYEANVVQSCIHCHQIRDAQLDLARKTKKPIDEQLLFSYPHPKSQGLIFDPSERGRVKEVKQGSTAAKAGFQEGDDVKMLNGQPILSIADVQWVLHQAAPKGATVEATVQRAGRTQKLAWELPENWRRTDDLSWRATTWGLRRIALGGMILEPSTEEQRTEAGVKKAGAGLLRVKNVGKFGPHATANNLGVRQGDLILEFDGRSDLATETEAIRHLVTTRMTGDRVDLAVLRNGKTLRFKLPIQP